MCDKPLPVVPGPDEVPNLTSLHHRKPSRPVGHPTALPTVNHAKLVNVQVPPSSAVPTKPDQSISPQYGRPLTTASASSAQDESSLSYHISLTGPRALSNANSLDAEKPRRYRLNMTSLSRGSYPWQIDDEPSLAEILDQERSAWLTQSSANTSPHSSNSPGRDSLSPKRKCTTSAQIPQLDHLAESCTASIPRCQSFGQSSISMSTVPCRSQEQKAAPASQKRRSCFQEGSMNETSRGVASSWHMSHLNFKQNSDSTHQSVKPDDEGTPTACAASRASTSSSIDIGDFKPLPATPSIFQSTITRFGQKLRHPDATQRCQEGQDHSKPKRRKRGLRKSVSSWRIFHAAASDREDGSEQNALRDPSTSGTIKSSTNLCPRGSQGAKSLVQQSVLDERKRKAEAIYAEQYSTIRKRHKSLDARDGIDMNQAPLSDTATVRTRKSLGLSRIRKTRSILHQVHDDQETDLNQSGCVAATPLLMHSTKSSASGTQIRPQSRDFNQTPDPNHGVIGERSNLELEKENKRTASTLQGQETNRWTRQEGVRHQQNSGLDRGSRGMQKVAIVACNALKEPVNHRAGEDTRLTTPHLAGPLLADYESSSDPMRIFEGVRAFHPSIDSIPPVPPIPPHLDTSRALVAVSGNARPYQEVATLEERKREFQLGHQAKLPRPLSTILEDMGAGMHQEQTARAGITYQPIAEKYCTSHNVATDEQDAYEMRDKTRGEWQWPEDVF